MVHAVCGASKILLYDCSQVIVDFDLDNKTFSYIDMKVSTILLTNYKGHDELLRLVNKTRFLTNNVLS